MTSTQVLHISNISPFATKEQIQMLFSYVGRIEEFKIYPSDLSMVQNSQQLRFAYIKFEDERGVEVGQHLTNTVFLDRALVCIPSQTNVIPDEETALQSGITALPGQRQLPPHITNQLQDMGEGQQMIVTIDPNLAALGLPAYPPLPPTTEPAKVEEIRRTVYVGNLPKGCDGEEVLNFFNACIGEVMYLRMAAGNDYLPCDYAYVEFSQQSSVPLALQNSDSLEFQGRPLRIQHSKVAIIKPQRKTADQALEEVEEAIKSGSDGRTTTDTGTNSMLLGEYANVEQLETEQRIKTALKQIMQSVDLDDVTSQDIRRRLSEQISVDQRRYKEFIDHQMLVILGQLDLPSKIFDYLYLGTEWNASNWEELKANGVQYILNVTKEVDNFFPTQFTYLKIWVSDETTTELLMHWQRTYDFIKEAKEKGAKVLVHCKKGISRSASTVIAYAMKAYGWGLDEALEYVKRKRDCITPNPGFMEQLGTFHGMLQASNNRHSAVFNLSRGGSLRQSESDGDKNETTTTPNLPSPPVIVTVTASTKTICPLMEPTQLTRATAKSGRKCGTDATKHQGTRRSSFPSSDYGFAHSRLCWNSGRVRQRRECFEQQFRRQTNKTNTTKQFVSNIAKKIGHLSLYGRFGGEIKSLRRDGLTTAGAGGATADGTATTANATAAAVMSTNVRSLVIAFEQRK